MESRPPPKLTFTTIEGAPDHIESPLTPVEVVERIRVGYERLQGWAATSAQLQYSGTDNLELFGLVLAAVADNERELAALEDSVNFVKSLCYPLSPRPGSLADGSPPRVLILWPGTLSLICRLEQVEVKRTMFRSDGRTTAVQARLDFVEVSSARIERAEIRRLGALRASPMLA